MTEVCASVSALNLVYSGCISREQLMAESANKEDGDRLDIAVNGSWETSKERAFFNIRVFSTANRQSSI